MFYNSADTHPISAVLSSQLSTKRLNTSIPIQLTFDIDKVAILEQKMHNKHTQISYSCKDKVANDKQQSCGFWDFNLMVERLGYCNFVFPY